MYEYEMKNKTNEQVQRIIPVTYSTELTGKND